MVVQTGDIIQITPESLAAATSQDVEWVQKFKNKKETYLKCTYENTTTQDDEKSGTMFIEKAKLENLKTLKLKGKADFSFEIKAEDVFLYGQAKGGTKRWIVFHDKSYKPFQHRFVDSTIKKFGDKATNIVSEMGYKDVGKLSDMAERFAGDPLREFKAATE
ncbi:hypothetical protein NA56DRAFT_685059 [Hyaloscypha hepaticicola]|uniref:Uncharacterized protein n=1 Tax=Hyaloscypha hepaticicola TaxID=2082293 RepID=A0A2J6QKE4_9HELO|nr:hypothetical protein NA56DRAFT_685059 [Hyaloscypha hepaticicola]